MTKLGSYNVNSLHGYKGPMPNDQRNSKSQRSKSGWSALVRLVRFSPLGERGRGTQAPMTKFPIPKKNGFEARMPKRNRDGFRRLTGFF